MSIKDEILTKSVQVSVTVEEVSALFCTMNSDEMADCFNTIGRIVQAWGNAGLPFQMQYVIDSEVLDSDGKYVMQVMAEYFEGMNK